MARHRAAEALGLLLSPPLLLLTVTTRRLSLSVGVSSPPCTLVGVTREGGKRESAGVKTKDTTSTRWSPKSALPPPHLKSRSSATQRCTRAALLTAIALARVIASCGGEACLQL